MAPNVLIGFVGDLHGRVLHALALIVTWQKRNERRFDLLIQVGDMAAFPDMVRLERTAIVTLPWIPPNATSFV